MVHHLAKLYGQPMTAERFKEIGRVARASGWWRGRRRGRR